MMTEVAMYCGTCGEVLVKGKDFVYGYDTRTGQAEIRAPFACPNYRWYRTGHMKGNYFKYQGTWLPEGEGIS